MSCPESQDSCCTPACRTKAAYFLGALVVILLGVGLNAMLKSYTETGAQAARDARAKERSKAQSEIRQTTAQELGTAALLDKAKGVYRIPVTAAMQLTLKDYENAAASRAAFVARVEKITAPPPKAPEKPSAFE
ncbi:MAG: hypothetical protein HZA92_02275 [Verrucomicrobia bacterium]|nr:hypothetical protein [Verrucomicrobiota bacterium]